ncbi:MAG: MAPEG family protein [Burkholderiaceae bacterium]
MNFVVSAVFLAGVLPVICAGISKAGMKAYDNHDPRSWLAKQTGFRSRANAAQSNSFEAFPFFAASVILAILAEADPEKIDALAGFFVLFRIAYIACYLSDKATARSLFWVLGYGCVIWLFILAA